MNWFKENCNKEIDELLELIFDYSKEGANVICMLQSIPNERTTEDFPETIPVSNRIHIEFILFYIHLLDRISYDILPEDFRIQMMAEFINRTIRTLPLISVGTKRELLNIKHGKWYFMQFIVRQDEYREYEKLISEDPFENTSLLRFGENISNLLFDELRDLVVYPCQTYVVESIRDLNIKDFVILISSKM